MAGFTHTLNKPVKLTLKGDGGERELEVTELTFPDPDDMTAGDLTATDGVEGEVAKAIALMAHLSGQPEQVIRRLHPVDFNAMNERLGSFSLPGG